MHKTAYIFRSEGMKFEISVAKLNIVMLDNKLLEKNLDTAKWQNGFILYE